MTMTQYTPEQIQAAIQQYQANTPLSNVEGTWANPNTAPMSTTGVPVDTSTMTTEAPAQPDWMGAARQFYGAAPAPAAIPAADSAPLSMPAAAQQQAMQTATVPAEPAVPTTPQEALKQYAQANAAEANAARARGEQTAKAHEAEALQANEQAGALDIAANEARQRESFRQKRYESLFQAAQKANQEADNMRIVDRRTTGQVVGGAIAQLGAILQDGFKAMGGNYNSNAFETVSKQLDEQFQRDLDRQREAIQDKRREAATRLSELGIARQMGLDEKDAEQYATGLIMQKHAQAAKALAANTQSVDAKAAGEQLGAHLEAQGAQHMEEALQRSSNAQANQEYLKEQAAHLRRMDARGGKGASPSISFDAIRQKIASGEQLSPDELKAASTSAYRDWSKGSTKTGGQEIIPGYGQDDNAVPLTQGEVNAIRKRYSATVGVQWLSNHLAELWEKAVDPNATPEEKARARSEYVGTKNDLLSGKSVSTGQGTITEGDAKRTGAAVPDLPTNWLGSVRDVENYVKGQDPGAESIRALGRNALEQLDAELADTYGIRKRQPQRSGGMGASSASGGGMQVGDVQVKRATTAADLD